MTSFTIGLQVFLNFNLETSLSLSRNANMRRNCVVFPFKLDDGYKDRERHRED